MIVRGKFQVASKTRYPNHTAETIKLFPQYDTNIPEDQRFAKATPSGEITLYVDNPAAQEALELGKNYYFDLVPVE